MLKPWGVISHYVMKYCNTQHDWALMSNEILDTNFHSQTCVAVCVRRYKEA